MYINEKTPQYPEESPEAIPVGHKASLRFIITCCISISQMQGLINNIFFEILKKSIFYNERLPQEPSGLWASQVSIVRSLDFSISFFIVSVKILYRKLYISKIQSSKRHFGRIVGTSR